MLISNTAQGRLHVRDCQPWVQGRERPCDVTHGRTRIAVQLLGNGSSVPHGNAEGRQLLPSPPDSDVLPDALATAHVAAWACASPFCWQVRSTAMRGSWAIPRVGRVGRPVGWGRTRDVGHPCWLHHGESDASGQTRGANSPDTHLSEHVPVSAGVGATTSAQFAPRPPPARVAPNPPILHDIAPSRRVAAWRSRLDSNQRPQGRYGVKSVPDLASGPGGVRSALRSGVHAAAPGPTTGLQAASRPGVPAVLGWRGVTGEDPTTARLTENAHLLQLPSRGYTPCPWEGPP